MALFVLLMVKQQGHANNFLKKGASPPFLYIKLEIVFMKSGSVFLIIFFVLFQSRNSKYQNSISKLETIDIQFDQARSQVYFSELIDTLVTIIPLQADLSKGVYLNSIQKVLFNENQVYVFDLFSNPAVQVFDQKGRFLRNIGKNGQAPDEYIQPMDFIFSNDVMEVLDVGKLLKFDFEGGFLGSERYRGFTASQFEKLGSGYAFISSGFNEDNLILTDNNLSILSSSFPYHTRALNPMLLHPLYTNPDGKVIFRRNLIDTLFEVSESMKIEPYLFINYQEYRSDLQKILESDDPEREIENADEKFANTLYFYESIG